MNPILSDDISAILAQLEQPPKPPCRSTLMSYAQRVRTLLQNGASPFVEGSFETVLVARGLGGTPSRYIYKTAWKRYCLSFGVVESPPAKPEVASKGPLATLTADAKAAIQELVDAGLRLEEITSLRWTQLTKVALIDGVLRAVWRIPPNTFSKRLYAEFVTQPAASAQALLRWAYGVEDTTALSDPDILVVPISAGQLRLVLGQSRFQPPSKGPA